MTEITILRPSELHGLVSMAEAIDAMALAYGGGTEYPVINAPRRRVHSPDGVRVSNFPGGIHALGVIGAQARAELVRQQDGHQYYDYREHPVVILNDSRTGRLMGVLFGEVTEKDLGPSSLMALRTAATSGVGFRHLAREDATLAGLIGTSGQALHQLQALLVTRPGITRVRVFGRDPDRRKAFAADCERRFGIEMEPVEAVEQAIRGVDVIACGTNTNVPLFDGNLLEPGQHITGIIGSNMQLVEGGFLTAPRRELDDATAARADVIVTNLKDSIVSEKQGDLWQPAERGLINLDDVADLGEVVIGRRPGRTSPEQITYHKNNNGTGAADLAIATIAFRKAVEMGRGMRIDL